MNELIPEDSPIRQALAQVILASAAMATSLHTLESLINEQSETNDSDVTEAPESDPPPSTAQEEDEAGDQGSLPAPVTETPAGVPGDEPAAPRRQGGALATGIDAARLSEPPWTLGAPGQRISKQGPGVDSVSLLAVDRSRYPRRPCEGVYEGARTLVYTNSGNIYVADTAQYVGRVERQQFCPSWNEHGIVYCVLGTRLCRQDVLGTRQEPALVFDFARVGATGQLTLGNYEGKPCLHDDLFVLTDAPITRAWVFSRSMGLVGAKHAADIIREIKARGVGVGTGEVDWMSVSIGGRYVTGALRKGCLFRYDVDMTNLQIVGSRDSQGTFWPLYPQHGDNLLDGAGVDAHAQVHWSGGIWWRWEAPEYLLRIMPEDLPGHGHISGNAIRWPGYLIHSARNGQSITGLMLDPQDYRGARQSEHEDSPERTGYPYYPTRPVRYRDYWGDGQFTQYKHHDSCAAQPNQDGSRVWFNTGNGDGFIMCAMEQIA